ncbi:MAG TPA: hypothetical protein VG755_40135 [Nannocystaceae bacterium]|nr:hypothetical protein [Nannocystaceae bacterium]
MQILTSLVAFALESTPPPAPPASEMPVVVAPAQIEGDLPELDRAAVQDALERGLAAPGLTLIDGAQACASEPCPDAHRVEMNVVAGARTYEIELRAYRPEQPDAFATASGRCDICGLAELEQLVLARADTLRLRLVADSEPVPATAVAPTPAPRPRVRTGDADRSKPSPRKIAGGVTLGVGIAALVSGAAMVGIDGAEIRSRCSDPTLRDGDGDCRWVHHTLAGGVVMTLVGTGLAATGIALLVIDHRKQRHELRATVGPTRVGLTLAF